MDAPFSKPVIAHWNNEKLVFLPMTVEECIESQSIRPASGEIDNIDLRVITSRLADPAQQNLFTVCLLQSSHDVFHYIFDLQ